MISAKMPTVHERELVASSSREVALWRRTYDNVITELNIVSEKQFIRHIMYLTCEYYEVCLFYNLPEMESVLMENTYATR